MTHEDTANRTRDADLRSDIYFDVAHYPTMVFHSTKITSIGPDDAQVTGTITIKNVTKTVTFPIHVEGRIPDSGGTRVGFTGGYDVRIGLTVEATSPDPGFLKSAGS